MSENTQDKVIVRYSLLDFLRWLLASYVFAFHIWGQSVGWTGRDAYTFFLQYGYLSVDIFFVISGLVITLKQTRHAGEFARKRIKRLIPPLVGIAFVNLCLVIYLLIRNGGSKYESISFSIINILPTTYDPSKLQNYVVWSIVIEIQFYALIYCYLLFNRNKQEIEYRKFMHFWLFLCYLSSFTNIEIIQKVFLIQFAPYFILGSLIAIQHLKQQQKISYFEWLALIPVLYKLIYERSILHLGPGGDWLGTGVIICGVVIICLSLKLTKFSPKVSTVSSLVGESSYFAYLAFGFFGMSLFDQFDISLSKQLSFLATYITCAALSIMYTLKIHQRLANFLLK